MKLKKGDFLITINGSIYEVMGDETSVGVLVKRCTYHKESWVMTWLHKSKDTKLITSKEGKKKMHEYLNIQSFGEG